MKYIAVNAVSIDNEVVNAHFGINIDDLLNPVSMENGYSLFLVDESGSVKKVLASNSFEEIAALSPYLKILDVTRLGDDPISDTQYIFNIDRIVGLIRPIVSGSTFKYLIGGRLINYEVTQTADEITDYNFNTEPLPDPGGGISQPQMLKYVSLRF